MNENQTKVLSSGTLLRSSYRIDKHLASGGFGNTYVATNIDFDERVAIKEFFMRDSMERDDATSEVSVSNADKAATVTEQREKFKKEARRLRKLKNEHIVRVHDLFDENGTTYYVMDFVDGENLSERMKRTGRPLTEKEVMDLLPQILDALKSVHDAGLWHLDMKPSNIMVDSQGKVKLIDFGASKQLNAQTGGAVATSNIARTDHYAPIEQLDGNYNKLGPWSDIYSLGATLFNLLTRQTPPTPSQIIDDETTDKSIALPMPALVGKKMSDLIVWMMQTNRAKRPQSIREIEDYINHNKNNQEATKARSATDVERERQTSNTQNSEETIVRANSAKAIEKEKKTTQQQIQNNSTVSSNDEDYGGLLPILIGIVSLIVFFGCVIRCVNNNSGSTNATAETTETSIEEETTNGQGTKSVYYYPMGNGTYVGNLKDGEPDGKGTITYSTGQKFVGYFSYYGTGSQPNGHGTFYAADGSVAFDGEYKNGTRVSGTQTFSNGNKFTGTYDEYGYPKHGKLISANGDLLFEGYFIGTDCGYGTGIGKYVDGDYSYEGRYENGEYNGHGIQRWKNAKKNRSYKHEGNFKNGYRNGKGTMYYVGGGWYEGNWKDGERNGEGTEYYSDHTYKTGIWKGTTLVKETDSGTWSEN